VLAGGRLYDLFVERPGGAGSGEPAQVNPELLRLARREEWDGRPGRGGRRPARYRPPRRPEVIGRLDTAGLLPAITFIFSRAGCDAAVRQCLDAGLRLTTPDEAAAITEIAERRTAEVPEPDLPVLGYGEWLTGLQRGIAAHHAGMLPTFKEVVEELFEAGLVRAVFATETLALGINMPARTVVIERLDKWNGDTHAALTPGEYTQLTGRAGRRGIDGHGPGGGGRAGRHPDLSTQIELPALLQHGGEPGQPGWPGARGRAARVLVRPVPGRPGGGGHRPAGPAQPAGAGGAGGEL
jgi:ATP-dependent RNA helicase HelY